MPRSNICALVGRCTEVWGHFGSFETIDILPGLVASYSASQDYSGPHGQMVCGERYIRMHGIEIPSNLKEVFTNLISRPTHNYSEQTQPPIELY